MKKVVVIGGGCSGLFASIWIKKLCPEMEVVVLERLEKVGKKILATGSGRCNFSNANMNRKKYNNMSFVAPFIKQLDYKKLCFLLEDMGLFTTEDKEGRAYPFCEMANSFLDTLRLNMKQLGIVEKCNFEVKKITNQGSDADPEFVIENTRKQKEEADIIVLATGGKSYPLLGSNGSGYSLLKPWKIKITPTRPGLVGVKVDNQSIKGLSGLRIKSRVSLWDKKAKQRVWEEVGEVQFKDDGVSGIVIMQMASIIARSEIIKSNSNYFFELDLVPNMDEDVLLSLLIKRKENLKTLENSEFLNGIFPRVLGFTLIRRSKIDLSGHINDISMRDLVRLAGEMKAFSLEYKGLYSFDRAQVTVGGIDLSELDRKTLELARVPNLYACGEVLDIDGECGGYNMHWALASGYAVAQSLYEKWGKHE